ncbi:MULTISPECIES: hydrolase [unclassified Virgibacillus]|uniref:hydrolase n=1 Tax=unclassified Virgibacillus TaxID=2620237 RepID=UPI0024DEE79F|nr:hydrolase [Virgibacillus sp. LDC-1]
MEKKKYFVNVGSYEISQTKYHNNHVFVIYATDEEIKALRGKMDSMGEANMGTYFRAHVPIMAYHNDKANDVFDEEITEVYRMLYALGDKTTKEHVESMGILGDKHM